MNLILLFDHDFIDTRKVRLEGRRLGHVKEILKAQQGQELTVGQLNGLIGQGKIIHLNKDSIEMEVDLKEQPPLPLKLTLVMALPRPPMLRRTLQCAASLGIKKIIILNCSKVEKSLWQSSRLKPEALAEDLVLGLEQAKDTRMPEVVLEKKFKPFVEDKLPLLIRNKNAFVAHPGEFSRLPKIGSKETVIIIGPEGGLSEFEVSMLKSKGIKPVTLGERILRFENVIPFIIGQLT
jgi:16S rRNA (uracil1498-N3)-methyltransferase